jgi:hypothetical protein
MIPQSNRFTCRTTNKVTFGTLLVEDVPVDVVPQRPVVPVKEKESTPKAETIDVLIDFDFPDRERPDQERDHSDWLNPYAQAERDMNEEYAFRDSFYERASTGDQYW